MIGGLTYSESPYPLSWLSRKQNDTYGGVMELSNDDGFNEFLSWAAQRGVTDVPRSRSASPVGLQNGISASILASISASNSSPAGLGHSLRVAHFPDAGGRGLMATRNIEEGEMILRVPGSALMSVQSAMEEPQLAKAINLQPKLSSHQILVVHLLNEVSKRKLSPWYTYLVQLPRRHHTLASFSQSAANALQVEDAVWAAQSAAAKATTDWEGSKELMVAVELKRKFRSLIAWLWASATVSSRSLYVPWDSAGTLCPVGDLFNYAPPGDLFLDNERMDGEALTTSNCSREDDSLALDPWDDFSCAEVTLKERLRDGGYDSECGEYCFYARKPYKAGEQVLLCYGQYTNLELLEHYGFCMAQNPNDAVHICPPEDFAGLSVSGSDRDGGTYVGVNGAPSFSLLARMRLHHVKPSLRKASRYTALRGEQICKESDVLAYQWLLQHCECLLACLPTSMEDDLALAKVLCSAQSFKFLASSYNAMIARNQGPGLVSSFNVNDYNPSFMSDKVMDELGTLIGATKLLHDDVIQTSSDARDQQDALLEQWRIAVEWRLGYKRVLHRCCTLCRRKTSVLLMR